MTKEVKINDLHIQGKFVFIAFSAMENVDFKNVCRKIKSYKGRWEFLPAFVWPSGKKLAAWKIDRGILEDLKGEFNNSSEMVRRANHGEYAHTKAYTKGEGAEYKKSYYGPKGNKKSTDSFSQQQGTSSSTDWKKEAEEAREKAYQDDLKARQDAAKKEREERIRKQQEKAQASYTAPSNFIRVELPKTSLEAMKVLFLSVPLQELTKKDLDKAYHRMAFQYHPDRAMSASKEKREECEIMSRKINAAYEILLKSLRVSCF